ncbi:glycosyltransferase family 4 protein [Kitasatospora sp. NPDC096077]|uniref:glycosyltransferase family 4 protein n=1 Tax=Kitasatospora sp. NPDC096077 TaxID=3155544 RepID=UPI003320E23D
MNRPTPVGELLQKGRQLRILRLTPWYYHDQVDAWPVEYDSMGGMQIQITRLSRTLAAHGVRQLVVTAGFPGLPRYHRDRDGLTVRVARAPIPPIRSELTCLVGLIPAWFAATLTACLGIRRWKPDLVHVHADGSMWPLLLAPLAARTVGAPYVLTLHCSCLAGYLSDAGRLRQRLAAAAERIAIRRAAQVITLTEGTGRLVAEALDTGDERFTVVPDFLDTEAKPAGTGRFDFAGWAAAAPGRPVIGFVGRIAHEKGWQHLVPLARRLRDLRPRFLVVGDGPQRHRLAEAIHDHGLTDDFLITGFIPNTDVPDALAVMSTALVPSAYEELGGAALEALSAGTPVAAFGVGGLLTTVGELCPQMLVPAGDLDALEAKVRQIAADPRHFADLAAAARPTIEERYGAPAAVRELTTVYRRALHPDSGRDRA